HAGERRSVAGDVERIRLRHGGPARVGDGHEQEHEAKPTSQEGSRASQVGKHVGRISHLGVSLLEVVTAPPIGLEPWAHGASYAPRSQRAEPSALPSLGRCTPRWSAPEQFAFCARSITGLPARSGGWGGLPVRLASLGSPENTTPTRHEASSIRFSPDVVIVLLGMAGSRVQSVPPPWVLATMLLPSLRRAFPE